MFAGEDEAQLQCCVTVEQLNSSGQATRRQVIRKASVILGRNEFQEIILRVHDGRVPQSYCLKEFRLFTKFAREGKCTVKLLPENIQVLMSNCPPDRLSLFLKTLSIKHQAWQSSKPLSHREKFKAGLPRSFEAISPLQQKDIQKVNELRSKQAPKGLTDRTNKAVAGTGQQVKRSRSESNFSPVSRSHTWNTWVPPQQTTAPTSPPTGSVPYSLFVLCVEYFRWRPTPVRNPSCLCRRGSWIKSRRLSSVLCWAGRTSSSQEVQVSFNVFYVYFI